MRMSLAEGHKPGLDGLAKSFKDGPAVPFGGTWQTKSPGSGSGSVGGLNGSGQLAGANSALSRKVATNLTECLINHGAWKLERLR